MARVSHVDATKVCAELRPLYEQFAAAQFGNQAGVLAHSAPVLRHLYGMVEDLRKEGELPQRLVEIAVVATSEANRCKYCVAHHGPVLKDLGLPAETVGRILDPDVPGLDERERLVRDYAVLVTEQPGRIRDNVFERLRKHFSERQIVELTARIAVCGVFNRMNDALQIESEV